MVTWRCNPINHHTPVMVVFQLTETVKPSRSPTVLYFVNQERSHQTTVKPDFIVQIKPTIFVYNPNLKLA